MAKRFFDSDYPPERCIINREYRYTLVVKAKDQYVLDGGDLYYATNILPSHIYTAENLFTAENFDGLPLIERKHYPIIIKMIFHEQEIR